MIIEWLSGILTGNPNTRTPGRSERGDEHAGGENHDRSNLLVSWIELRTNCGEDKQPSHLPNTTIDERTTTTEALNKPQAGECHNNVDNTENNLGEERVLNSDGGENGGTEVEEVVGTGELLANLEQETKDGTVKSLALGIEGIDPGGLTGLLGLVDGHRHLIILALETILVLGLLGLVDEADGSSTLVGVAVGEQPTGRLGEQEHANTENNAPGETDADGRAPLSRRVSEGVGTQVDAVGGQKTESNKELVRGNESTADLLGNGLREVNGHQSCFESDRSFIQSKNHCQLTRTTTDGQSGNEAGNENLIPGVERGDENGVSDVKDTAKEDDSLAAANFVTHRASDQRTEESTNRHHTDDETDTGITPRRYVIRTPFRKTVHEVL